MYHNGEQLTEDAHFQDHMECVVPVQIYCHEKHSDIGFIENFCSEYVIMNQTQYDRNQYVFISRPGY